MDESLFSTDPEAEQNWCASVISSLQVGEDELTEVLEKNGMSFPKTLMFLFESSWTVQRPQPIPQARPEENVRSGFLQSGGAGSAKPIFTESPADASGTGYTNRGSRPTCRHFNGSLLLALPGGWFELLRLARGCPGLARPGWMQCFIGRHDTNDDT